MEKTKLKAPIRKLLPSGNLKAIRRLKQYREILIILLLFFPLLFEIVFGMALAKKYNLVGDFSRYDKTVYVLDMNRQLSVKYANDLMDKLDKMVRDKEIDHLLVVMNSPGGGAQASEELAHYFKYLQKKIPVTLYIESIAASGGYFIASSFKPIIASSTAIVGSIGVILPAMSAEDLAKKVGVKEVAITVGKYKHPLSWFKTPTEEDIAYLKRNLLDPSFRNFASFVAKNRGMTMEQLAPYTEGKIFVASEEVGPLVDRISSLVEVKQEIYDTLKKTADGEVGFKRLEVEEKKGFPFFKAEFNVASPLRAAGQAPSLQY